MDRKGTKRPRSSTPNSKLSETKKKKSSKKKDKNKKVRIDDNSKSSQQKDKHSGSSRHHHKDTATPDGHMMAQMLSTFSTLEQSRFQAYKRACFSADTVEAWITACLKDRYGIVDSNNSNNDNTNPQNNNKNNNTTANYTSLGDLVAPGQAQDIALVVSVAAKIYAQRLVSETVQNLTSNNNSTNNSSSSSGIRTVKSLDIWKTVTERKKRGVDPGFFMQSINTIVNNNINTSCIFNPTCNVANTNTYNQKRLAAQLAQEEYDKHIQQQQEEEKDDDDDNNNDDDDDGKAIDDAMDLEEDDDDDDDEDNQDNNNKKE